MSVFHFNLERVMHWRGLQLKSEESKLTRLIEKKALLESELNAIVNAIAEIPVMISALEEIHGSDLNGIAAYRVQLTTERDKVVRRCSENMRLIAQQAEAHRVAKQRHRLLEELRARRHDEWKASRSRELDELAHDSYLARWNAK